MPWTVLHSGDVLVGAEAVDEAVEGCDETDEPDREDHGTVGVPLLCEGSLQLLRSWYKLWLLRQLALRKIAELEGLPDSFDGWPVLQGFSAFQLVGIGECLPHGSEHWLGHVSRLVQAIAGVGHRKVCLMSNKTKK